MNVSMILSIPPVAAEIIRLALREMERIRRG